MTDERIERMVATIIDKVIGASRDFTFEVMEDDSSVLGTMSKRSNVTVSIITKRNLL